MKKVILILLLLSFSFADIIWPENNSTLNTTHVLFEWEQVPEATSYILSIYNEICTKFTLY